MSTHVLKIDLRTFWHPGGGRGHGLVLDAVAHRDSGGLPVLPGRHIKGLLRDALERAELWGWTGYDGLASVLFGDRTEEIERTGGTPRPGCLRVGDGRLPTRIAHSLSADKSLCKGLFRPLHATAVEPTTGTAKDKSLRGIEVVIPLQIEAMISPVPGQVPPADWPQQLSGVLPLIHAVGAHRTRGLGRAVLRMEKE